MNAPEERVELLVTVHGPVDALLLAKLAQVVANHVPGSRAESVDGEADIVFVRPAAVLPQAYGLTDTNVAATSVTWSSGPIEAPARPLAVVPDPEPDPDEPDPAAHTPAWPGGQSPVDRLLEPEPDAEPAQKPRIGASAVGTADAPVIIDPSYWDAETRARRLHLYLAELDLPENVPHDIEAAKDAHRRGVLWKSSEGVWHCPWCPRPFKQAAHAGRHRQGCPRKPGEHEDRRVLAVANPEAS